MIRHKTRDAKDRPSASPIKGLLALMPVGRAGRAKPSEIKPGAPRANKLNFLEDFTQEHSLPGLHITSIEILGTF